MPGPRYSGTARCSMCGISYPTSKSKCEICEGKLDRIQNENPDPDWKETVDRTNGLRNRVAGTYGTAPDKVWEWRRDSFVALGFNLLQAERLADTRAGDGVEHGFLYWGTAKALLDKGCTHVLAFDLLT